LSTDDELMIEVKKGDLDKLGVLYEKYNRPLFAYFYKMTSDSPASEDLVHVVFCKVLKYREHFRAGEGSFSVWLFRIAHNAGIDHFHKEKPFRNADNVEDMDLKSNADTIGDFDRKERAERMRRALNGLTDIQRETLILSRFHDLTYDEIARIMHCREGTIKARVFRAMETLRGLYGALEKPS
jgi:RNA polymerase sigma factor (sigma-70 family)